MPTSCFSIFLTDLEVIFFIFISKELFPCVDIASRAQLFKQYFEL